MSTKIKSQAIVWTVYIPGYGAYTQIVAPTKAVAQERAWREVGTRTTVAQRYLNVEEMKLLAVEAKLMGLLSDDELVEMSKSTEPRSRGTIRYRALVEEMAHRKLSA